MKKFLLTLLLVLAVGLSYAQVKDYDVEPIVHHYRYAMVEENGVKGEWVISPSTLTLYNRTATLKIRDITFYLTQASDILYGMTDNGFEYKAVKLMDGESKTIMVLQIFTDLRMGIRLVHDAKNSIQFSN